MLDGAGNFDRANATGRLALDSTAASLGQVTGLIAPLVPALATRLNSIGTTPGPARIKLTLDLDRNAEHADRVDARAVFDVDAPQLKGVATVTAKPDIAALRGIDLDALRRIEFSVEFEAILGKRPLVGCLAGARSRSCSRRRPGAI